MNIIKDAAFRIVTVPNSPTMPYVMAFARKMEAKLDKNRHKGDRAGWMKMRPEEALLRIRQEVNELADEVNHPVFFDKEAAANECADIANFCMMLADICGELFPERN